MTDQQFRVLCVFLDNLTKRVERIEKTVTEKRGRTPIPYSSRYEKLKYQNLKLKKELAEVHTLLNKEL